MDEIEGNPQPGGRLTVPKRNTKVLGYGCIGLLAVAAAVGTMIVEHVGEEQLSGGNPPAVARGAEPASSPAPAPPSAPAKVTDNPAFDLTGSGTDCVMTYGSMPDGRTVTVITVDVPGEIITHVSDQSGTVNRHDEHITQGPNAFVYDFPLDQVGDMGAVFTPDGGDSQSCTIKPEA